MPRRTLFTGATVLTMDPAIPDATALLITDGRVERAGHPDALRASAPDAEQVHLPGRLICPGFVDAHNHFSLTALEPISLDCRTPPVRSMDHLLARLRDTAARLPAGQWLRGHGYDEASLGGRHPSRTDLDTAAPHNPAVLVHWTVHRCVANTAALRAAGIAETDPDPPGGRLPRDPSGALTGLCYERASDPLQAASLAAYVEQHGDALPALFQQNAVQMLRYGIIAVGDAYVHPALAAVYERTLLPLTVRPFCGSTDGLFAPPLNCLARSGDASSGRLLPHGVKLFVDGGGNTTAASLASGRPPRFLFYRQEELDALVERAHVAGLPAAIHAAGDIAVTMALDAIERARLAHPALPARFRIEHAITLKQADIPRLRSLDVAVVTQAEAVFQAGDRLATAGLAEGVRIAPFRDLLDAGVTLALSSDSPCYALLPLWQIWCAAFRRTHSGAVLDDGQALTVEQALHASTRAGAAALFTDRAGALTAGAPADFVVLSADPRYTPPDRWRRLDVEAVYIDGEPVDFSYVQDPPPGRPMPLL